MRRIAATLSLLAALFALWWGASWLHFVLTTEPEPGVAMPPFGIYVAIMLVGAVLAARAFVLILKRREGREPVVLLSLVAFGCAGFTLPWAQVVWTTGLIPLVAAGLAHALRPKPLAGESDDEADGGSDGESETDEANGEADEAATT